jgi:hypothetical protein
MPQAHMDAIIEPSILQKKLNMTSQRLIEKTNDFRSNDENFGRK